MQMLVGVWCIVATDWQAWYEKQAVVRSETPAPQQQRWLQSLSDECKGGDGIACAYMLAFRTLPLKDLSFAAQQVLDKCAAGERSVCESGLKIAEQFAVVYYDHTLSRLRERFPQDVYKQTCLQFSTACQKFDVDACVADPGRCNTSARDLATLRMRSQHPEPNDDQLQALVASCGTQGVAGCRPRDMAAFKMACPAGDTCFVSAYDAFLRGGYQEQEDTLFAALAKASKETPGAWLNDVRIAQCLRDGQPCSEKTLPAKDRALLQQLKAKNFTTLDGLTHPATALVLRGEAVAEREKFVAARKARGVATAAIRADLAPPKTAVQSAAYAYMQEIEENVAQRVARHP